jgi:hypothetical protein
MRFCYIKRFSKLILAISLFLFCVHSGCSAAQAESDQLKDPIEQIFSEVYSAWNQHDIEKLFSYYSNNFVTGDSINKEQYKKLTKKLWDSYPDIKIENQKRTIRSQDQYSSVSSIDFFYGTTRDRNEDLNEFGKLNAISQGQLFFKKYGDQWKIESDRVHFELVTIYYANAKKYLDEHEIYFGAPEQVSSGEQYTGALYFALPENVKATAAISRELITSAPDEIENDAFQAVDSHKLERLFQANESNYNELVSATIVLSRGIIEPKLDGILYISKRVNVLSRRQALRSDKIANTPYAFTKELKNQSKQASKPDQQISGSGQDPQ